MTSADAAREAARAANEAVRDLYAQREFKIVRFGRHRDGYLQAFARIADSEPVYVFERFGSWQIPSEPQPGYPDYDGPRLRDVVAPYSLSLSEEAQRFRKAEHKRREEAADVARSAGRSEAAQAA